MTWMTRRRCRHPFEVSQLKKTHSRWCVQIQYVKKGVYDVVNFSTQRSLKLLQVTLTTCRVNKNICYLPYPNPNQFVVHHRRHSFLEF